jgi:hypothetical protein
LCSGFVPLRQLAKEHRPMLADLDSSSWYGVGGLVVVVAAIIL